MGRGKEKKEEKRRRREEVGYNGDGSRGRKNTTGKCLGGFPNRKASIQPRYHMITLDRFRSSSPTLSFAASSAQTDNMDTCKRFFSKIFDAVEKHVGLPPDINTKPETILQILHNHHLLVQNMWPNFTIKSINRNTPATTIFALEKPTKLGLAQEAVTFTSFEDGVSVLEEVGPTTRYRTHWTVTKTTTTTDQYSLRETFATSDEFLELLYRLKDDCHHLNTKWLVHLFNQIATGKVCISDVSEGEVRPLASSQQRCVDTAKLKND